MEIYEKLQEIGLTGNESKVYLELLTSGELSANNLAKNLGIDRTLTYTVLNHLIEKGQARYTIKEGKKYFSSTKPENLLNPLKAKEIVALDTIKELNKIRKQEQKEIEINMYEGKEAFRVLFNHVRRENEFLALGSTGKAFYQLYEMPAIAKEFEKRNITVKILGHKKYKGTEPFSFKKFQYKYLDIESEATTTIFGDYISIHLIKGKPAIILIKNKEMAKSYKNHFNYLWKQAKQ
ncbi:MAG: helix-turn-helix domain-containing protein [Nanoarchaeota archaeon]